MGYKISFSKIIFLLFCLGLAGYANAIFHPFVHDDLVFLANNPRIDQWDHLSKIFLNPTPQAPAFSLANFYYRPLLEVLYKIQYRMFSRNPWGYHLFNVLLHIGNSILVYKLMELMLNRKGLAFLVAGLFLIHPVQTEAVASIAGVSNLLFSFLGLISFIFYIQAAPVPERYRAGRARGNFSRIFFYSISSVFLIGALLSKEQAVVLPLLFAVYEFLFSVNGPLRKQSRKEQREGLLRLAGACLIVLLYLCFRGMVTPSPMGLGEPPTKEFLLRILHIPTALLTYGRILLFPLGLHYYRSTDILKPFIGAVLILTVLMGILVILIRAMSSENRRLAVGGLVWFLIGLLPTLNIIPLINEYSLILTAEHFLYLPSVGFFLFVLSAGGAGGAVLFKKHAYKFGAVFLSLVILIFVLLTVHQNTFWRGEIPLFERMVQFEPNFARGRILLARAYYFNKELDWAIREYKIGLEIMHRYLKRIRSDQVKPFYLGFIKGIHFDLAHCYEDQGNRIQAVQEYQEALALDPIDGVLHNNLGLNYLYLNEPERAWTHFQKAAALNPQDPMAQNNLAIWQIQKGNLKEAKEILETLVKSHPQFQPARENLERLRSQIP